jgi:ABC-type glycerol-3-phosphate transport system substrate-binding protein|tara:strand:+ start:4015 stop:4266 length:252 start_codon:yes stop_codon:yes gene_type:complete
MMNRTAALTLPLAAMLGLAACSQAEEKTYEADATDQSGGELIVTDENPDAVPVDTPDTAMKPVPDVEAAQPGAMPSAETTPDE